AVTMPLFLERISLQSAGDTSLRTGIYAPSAEIALPDTTISGQGIKGDVTLEDGVLQAELLTVGLSGDGRVRLRHDLPSGAGSLSVTEAQISFGARALDRRFSPWPYAWNITAGTATFGFDASWRDSGGQLDGTGTIRVDDIAGFYNEIAFTSLSTVLLAEYATESGLTLAPADLRIGLVDVGLPVENITAAYTLRPADATIDIRDLRMEAFDGVIRADPFSFHTGDGSNHLVLHAERINLAELLAMQEFEAIYVAGTISAELPVSIEGDRVTVTGGRLTGEAPGGTIRYGAGGASADSASALDIATRALSNFEFDALSSSVDYGGDGDLKLQMRLSGRNPDMEGSRPVVLNLGVESNIPEMLRSLQAARAVEEIIEKRMAQ
ncbi:MAG: YdbH domain-containing protein, partial [Gammaproteobacteria bacterium]|nr:YdbH domain-containing protein [Gammaproteobacteria bacterium]